MDNNYSVLVVIDMQKGFVNENTKYIAKDIRGHIESTNYDYIIFTKFINRGNSNFFNRLGYDEMTEGKDLEIVDELMDIAKKSSIVEKNTYSCFKSEEFIRVLDNIRDECKLFLCGVDIDACVLATAFECFDIGIEFEIIQELTASSGLTLDKHADAIIRRNISYI